MQISFTKNKDFIKAARIYKILGHKFVLKNLKFSSFIAFFSTLILILQYFKLIGFEDFSPHLKFSVTIGLIAFAFLRFIEGYFRELEDGNILKNQENQQFFEICDFETARIIGSVKMESVNLIKVLTDIASTKRASFISAEMNLNSEVFNKLLSDYAEKDQSFEQLTKIIQIGIEMSLDERSLRVTAGDIFYGFLKHSQNYEQILTELELDDEDIQNIVFWENNFFEKYERPDTLTQKLMAKSAGIAQDWASGYTLHLDCYSRNITRPNELASFTVEDREAVINQIENTLTKDSKNDCLLLGPTGVGKLSIVQGFADRICWGKCTSGLEFSKIAHLDIGSIMAGVKTEHEIEQRLIEILNDVTVAGNVILFIDDIHNIFSGGKPGAIDVSQIIRPYLENSNVRIIGTTTDSYYETYIAPKPSLAGCFERINVPPTDEHQTIRILQGYCLYFSNKYRIRITYGAIKEIYRLADQLITGKAFPQKAIDLLDNLSSTANNSGSKVLDRHLVDSLAEKILNVPIEVAEENEKKRLINLEGEIHGRVIGQDEAVKAVSNAMRRARTGASDSKRPIGSFLFLGPTGVGKTELAKALAQSYFGKESTVLRMDMNEYQTKDSVDVFIGKKIVGLEQFEGGEFVKKVRKNPFSVILLDELEKAHPDILNLFLQLLDEGYITDGMGETLTFSNSIIIATSNAGANLIRKEVGQNTDKELLKQKLLDYLQEDNIYRPEFLNRFDSVIIFKPLNENNLIEIAKLMFKKIQNGFQKMGYKIDINPAYLEELARLGYQPEFGARPMRRVFQEKVENLLAEKIIENSLNKGELFTIDNVEEKTSVTPQITK